ncbi:type II secretion system minor pseudopilin GspI [Paraburkholderia fungorum]|uniref:Type II secretion system protein I n=1 Tax=Paraburkholderia fungorum TaxID=134537 RepID=A0A3R7GXK8_9BURK|nr:type II secretion system minor pseudopilin GspI [Paraburkholderia fungorum]RKF50614.1 type II secretion system protein GspI [Paraburkholderia fungorum]
MARLRDARVKRSGRHASGFTLIEVLIALAIVAIALGATLRAIGSLSSNTEAARTRMLALWSADNALSELLITRQWPDVGRRVFACPQGGQAFICRETVSASESPLIRAVTVAVYPNASTDAELAAMATVVQNETR